MRTAERRRSAQGCSVLVAYDGSPEAQRALEHAIGLTEPGARLTIINVIPVQAVSSRLQTISDERRESQEQLLSGAQRLLARRGIKARVVDAAGDPLTEILATAEEVEASTLVVGRRLGRHLHSSLGDRLVKRARCDVLVVH